MKEEKNVMMQLLIDLGSVYVNHKTQELSKVYDVTQYSQPAHCFGNSLAQAVEEKLLLYSREAREVVGLDVDTLVYSEPIVKMSTDNRTLFHILGIMQTELGSPAVYATEAFARNVYLPTQYLLEAMLNGNVPRGITGPLRKSQKVSMFEERAGPVCGMYRK